MLGSISWPDWCLFVSSSDDPEQISDSNSCFLFLTDCPPTVIVVVNVAVGAVETTVRVTIAVTKDVEKSVTVAPLTVVAGRSRIVVVPPFTVTTAFTVVEP